MSGVLPIFLDHFVNVDNTSTNKSTYCIHSCTYTVPSYCGWYKNQLVKISGQVNKVTLKNDKFYFKSFVQFSLKHYACFETFTSLLYQFDEECTQYTFFCPLKP